MRIALVTLVAAGSGCAQIFAIDETSAPDDVSVALQRVSIGASVVTSPLDLTTAPSFVVDDTEVPATPSAPGQWSAGLSGTPSVLYTAPDLPQPFEHDLAFATRSTRANFLAFEHPSPQPAPASTVMVNVTLPAAYAATQSLEIDAIGAWTRHVLAGAELPAVNATAIATTIPYASFAATTSSPPARISSMDQVVVLRYTGQALTGVLSIPPFDQSDTADMLAGTMTAVTPDTPFGASIDPTMVAARYGALMPAMPTIALSWRVAAAPGYSVGAFNGIGLAGAAIATTDTSFASSYSNPFAALPWSAVLTYATSATRTYTLGGNPVTLSASLSSSVEPTPGMILDLPAGLAPATIDGTPLTTDGMSVMLDPTTALDVTLAPDNASNTIYTVRIDEITVVGMSVTRTPIVSVEGPGPQLALPPRVLQTGHTYTLVTACIVGGVLNAASGDLQTFALPLSVGQVDSAVFTVAAP